MMCIIEGHGLGKTIRTKKEVAKLLRNGVRVLYVSKNEKPQQLKGNAQTKTL